MIIYVRLLCWELRKRGEKILYDMFGFYVEICSVMRGENMLYGEFCILIFLIFIILSFFSPPFCSTRMSIFKTLHNTLLFLIHFLIEYIYCTLHDICRNNVYNHIFLNFLHKLHIDLHMYVHHFNSFIRYKVQWFPLNPYTWFITLNIFWNDDQDLQFTLLYFHS